MQVACVLKQLKQLIYFVIRHTRHLYVSSYRCIRHAIRWLLVFFLRLFAICLLDNCVFSTLGRSSYGIRYDSRFFLLLIDYHQFSEIHLGYLIGWGSSLVLLFFFAVVVATAAVVADVVVALFMNVIWSGMIPMDCYFPSNICAHNFSSCFSVPWKKRESIERAKKNGQT